MISTNKIKNKIKTPVLVSKNPRLDFQRVVMNFFVEDEIKSGIHETAVIEIGAKIGKNVFIGSNCFIGKNVSIGNNTKILSNTCIFGNTTIGKNSVIGAMSLVNKDVTEGSIVAGVPSKVVGSVYD